MKDFTAEEYIYRHYNDFSKEDLALLPTLDPSYIDENGFAENIYWNGEEWEYVPMD